jgi:hypothetical protein
VSLSRRSVLLSLAGGATFAAGLRPANADKTKHIEALIGVARVYERISQRIAYISAELRGTRYLSSSLIGGPKRQERFVVRDDGFDCVTYCETVLAAARARDRDEFETALRNIRYHDGVVEWHERNHYFFEWGEHNVENGFCDYLHMDGEVEITKTVYWHRELGKRQFRMTVIPRKVFLSNKDKLVDGDIVGFVTRRQNLDYFHIGFVIFGDKGEFLLRHAARSKHKVLDERMDRFCAINRVSYVTLLRPREQVVKAAPDKAGAQ